MKHLLEPWLYDLGSMLRSRFETPADSQGPYGGASNMLA
jgi:hypothetical protein